MVRERGGERDGGRDGERGRGVTSCNLVYMYLSAFTDHVNIRPKMCRIYFKERDIKTITPTVRSYCK